jgi:AcrR family transcriptional regulator
LSSKRVAGKLAAVMDRRSSLGRREAKRRRALDAMTEAVGERGYADTTVRDVLVRARMSRRTFYELFENREECFLAAYDAARGEALARLDRERQPDEPWPRHAEGALRRILEFLAERPAAARLLVVEPASSGSAGVERHERTMRALVERLVRSRAQVAASTDGDAELRLRCEAGVGAVHRVVQARIVEGSTSSLPQLAPELAGVLDELSPTG